MPATVVITKLGEIQAAQHRSGDISDIHKRAGLRKPTGFAEVASWPDGESTVSLWSKREGRAGQENKAELPPPIDSTLLFGNVVVCRHVGSKMTDITPREWETFSNALFGGFESLDHTDDDDDGIEEAKNASRHGYDKSDGFVVSDSEELEEEEFA